MTPPSESARPRVLVICDYYLPGYKSGGGMRTIVNTVERLSDEFEFFVLTRDHDGKGDRTPYPGIRYGEWIAVGEARVKYLHQSAIKRTSIEDAVKEVMADVVYLNSIFSTLTFHVLRTRSNDRAVFPRTLLAPCGELSSGARRSKKLKKAAYIKFLGLMGHLEGMIWKASSASEVGEISAVTGPHADIHIAPDLVSVKLADANIGRSAKAVRAARLVFLSRISPKKNLRLLIDAVLKAGPGASLDIYGDTDDESYLNACKTAAMGHADIRFCGPVEHAEVPRLLASYDFFALPTLNENFGHVVVEALSAGCPVLVSTETPWKEVNEVGAGMMLPVELGSWCDAILRCIEMDPDEHEVMVQAAKRFADKTAKDEDLEAATRRLLRLAYGRSSGGS